eukprot:TRINITY_DN5615_c0_g1_i2.p1 TRINITY_DN5615_c0_g1~~TRINITY_DN5615_c0_g1_i2.p1  ORF type:complete len:175 (+),score=5.78 TRINITY_DN5615_c0_g1_i2:94-618(+)
MVRSRHEHAAGQRAPHAQHQRAGTNASLLTTEQNFTSAQPAARNHQASQGSHIIDLLYPSITSAPMSNVQALQQYMGQYARVSIADGRLISGRLYCFDQQGNILLSEADETNPEGSSSSSSSDHVGVAPVPSGANRFLGMAMIPARHVRGCWIAHEETDTEVAATGVLIEANRG